MQAEMQNVFRCLYKFSLDIIYYYTKCTVKNILKQYQYLRAKRLAYMRV